jgi:endonuclease/exonuclease/phosphatase family metal-dependent hydrolase
MILRFKQAKRLIDLLKEHVLERGEVVFVLGDFNAVPTEPCISSVLEREGFVRLVPTEGPGFTHCKHRKCIDHVFMYPRNRLVEHHCWIVDSETAWEASDHLPVVADVMVS